MKTYVWIKKIVFLWQLVGKLLGPTQLYCKSILAAILAYTFSTNGILLDFYYVVLYNIFLYILKKN